MERTGGYTAAFVVTASIAITRGLVFLVAGSGKRTID